MTRFASPGRSSLLAAIAIAAIGCGGGGGGSGSGGRGGTTGAGGRGGSGAAGTGGTGAAGVGGSAGAGVAGGGGAAAGVGGGAGIGGAAGSGAGGSGGAAGVGGGGAGAGGAAGSGAGGVGGSAGAAGSGGGAGATGSGGAAGTGGVAGAAGGSGSGGSSGGGGNGGGAGTGGGAGAAGAGGDAGTGGAGGTGGSAGAAGAGGGAGSAGSGGAAGAAGNGGAGAGGSAGDGGTGGGAGTGGSGGGGTGGAIGGFGGGGTGGSACQSVQIVFQPVAPTVYVLAERSGSMFTCLSSSASGLPCATPTDTAWSVLKEAVRSVVTADDAQVRFGFSDAWGTNPSAGGMCPSQQGLLTDAVAPAFANGAAIMAKYDSLPAPPNTTVVGMKFESPVSSSIKAVGQALGAISAPGDKYILLVTNGWSDYCDDGNSLCPPDSVVWRIQASRLAGITTLVIGIDTPDLTQPTGVLQAWANAGAGESTMAPLRTGDTPFAFYDQCSGSTGWHADLVESGKPIARGSTLGTYSATAGPSRPYTASAADQAAIAARLKSCRFDLAGNLRVDTSKLSLAHVRMAGTEVPLDATDGWSMATDTQVVLNGAACTAWRTPGHDPIDLQFPCEILLVP